MSIHETFISSTLSVVSPVPGVLFQSPEDLPREEGSIEDDVSEVQQETEEVEDHSSVCSRRLPGRKERAENSLYDITMLAAMAKVSNQHQNFAYTV